MIVFYLLLFNNMIRVFLVMYKDITSYGINVMSVMLCLLSFNQLMTELQWTIKFLRILFLKPLV